MYDLYGGGVQSLTFLSVLIPLVDLLTVPPGFKKGVWTATKGIVLVLRWGRGGTVPSSEQVA